MNKPELNLLSALSKIVGESRVLQDEASLQRYGRDWTKAYLPQPTAIVLPASIDEIVALVKLANELGLSLVPSGGRTGLSGGAVASNGEIVVAMDRMNKILDFNAVDRQCVCQPGVLTGQLQQYAQDKGLFYPVDFASSGSSQIGGNVATNAGGIKVIRYGMTRNWIQGLKVVTGNGDLLDLNKGLSKNATGYDLRHLFIGSEGTLGLIAEVTVSLTRQPCDPTVILLGVDNLVDCMKILQNFQEKMSISAFEFFSEQALSLVTKEKGLQRPFESRCPFYALIEFENDAGTSAENSAPNNVNSALERAMSLFEHCMEAGWVIDGTISQNLAQAKNLWRLREDISETIAQFTPYKNDISVRVSRIPDFLAEIDALVNKEYPDFEIIWFGHIGDGNVHLNILKPADLPEKDFFIKCADVSQWVFELVDKYEGSVSAEHGVGLLKKPFLHFSRSEAEINYMRAMKQVFDPKGIMNPGKMFDIQAG